MGKPHGARALLLLGVLAVTGCSERSFSDAGDAPSADARSDGAPKRIVIMMIGDGMGREELAVASHFATGAPAGLFIDGLPQQGDIATPGPSGITDSAAAATALATGVFTLNGRVGVDRGGRSVQNLVELAHDHGLAAGLVTTTSLTHATPAGFAAHVPSRGQEQDIAAQLVEVAPEVLIGGGTRFFQGRDDGRDLSAELADRGYAIARDAGDLEDHEGAERLLGLLASNHMPYSVDRAADSELPSLAAMSRAALAALDRDPDGFFLMIEGGRIDHAGHANQLERQIGETLDFDDAVRAVSEWAEGRDEVTLLVTADHETGGLRVVAGNGAGVLPTVTWRWGAHTSALVPFAGFGPGSELAAGQVRDHRWLHAIAAARIANAPVAAPGREVIANGYFDDLAGPAAIQNRTTDLAPSKIDRVVVDADAFGLGVGVEGVFEWQRGAIVVLIDLDHGAGTGVKSFDGSLRDRDGVADALLSNLRLAAPDDPGWGADVALVSIGALDPKVGQDWQRAGLRGLAPPLGTATELGHLGAAMNFADASVSRGEARDATSDQGFEAFVPWDRLYPKRGAPPLGAGIAVTALLVNDDGSVVSNQALPPFPVTRDLEPRRSQTRTLPRPLPFEP